MNKMPVAPGLKGFDADGVVKPTSAKALWNKGYRFALRYVRRVERHADDLGQAELEVLLSTGFGVMPVQHVESGFWTPDEDKARTYGDNAALAACELGIPKGVTVWLDLESVKAGTPAQIVIDYCNLWHERVYWAGYQPGIYVGFQPILTGDQLYTKLRFTRYWSAYNLNADQFPVKRGVCMKQRPAAVNTLGFDFDEDIAQNDDLGGFATMAVK